MLMISLFKDPMYLFWIVNASAEGVLEEEGMGLTSLASVQPDNNQFCAILI